MKTTYTIEELCAQLAQRDAEIALLREQVALLKALQFARSSEKTRRSTACESQMSLFDEIEFVVRHESEFEEVAADDVTQVPAHTRKKRGRRPINSAIPRQDVVIDIPEEQKTCPCGCALTRIGEEVSEKLHIIPQTVLVKRFIRYKYACKGCEGTEDEGQTVKIASMPMMLIKQGIVTASLLAYILIAKFCDALPFYRQTVMFRRLGVEISRATMSSWALQAARQCAPLIALFAKELREGPIINMDETPVQVLREKDRANTTKSYMWVARGGRHGQKVVLFRYAPTRAGHTAVDIVGPEFCGYLQTDGYGGYEALGNRAGIHHVGCLVHVRRKFVEIGKASKNTHGVASTVLDYIKKVYHIEKILREKEAEDAEILDQRNTKIRPILAKIKDTLDKTHAPPQSLLGKAVTYALGQWNRIEAYLDHPKLTPDNNAAENAIRPFVVGRKNWLFSGSPRGADASATLYSLIETAKANGLNPNTYLLHVFETLPTAKSDADIKALLPWNVSLGV